MKNQNTWSVYIHTSPSGKVYVGITHIKPELRWGKGGNKYCKKTVFSKAIQKYGWDNFKHEILFYNCSEEVAKTLEIVFIKYYKDRGLSYNMTIGGDGHNLGKDCTSAKYRTEQSKLYRASHPEYDKNQYTLHKEKKKRLAREYYWKNRGKILDKKKADIKGKQDARLRAAEWRKKHPNYMKKYMRNYNNLKRISNE